MPVRFQWGVRVCRADSGRQTECGRSDLSKKICKKNATTICITFLDIVAQPVGKNTCRGGGIVYVSDSVPVQGSSFHCIHELNLQ